MWQCEIRRFGSLPTFMCEEVWPGVGMVTKPRLHMHTHHLGILPLVPRILAMDQISTYYLVLCAYVCIYTCLRIGLGPFYNMVLHKSVLFVSGQKSGLDGWFKKKIWLKH